jgi:23S rRNA (cytosine1962-C5)-methyltransferase
MASDAQPGSMTVHITRRAADRIRAGHVWVYRSEIERSTGEDTGIGLATVVDARGKPLGTGLYNATSEIAVRIVSTRARLSRGDYFAELRKRLNDALALRRSLVPDAFTPSTGTSACRLFFSEADGLPGIIADRYNDIVVLQLLTQSTARDDVRGILRDVLAAEPWVGVVVERPDPRIRELEQLSPTSEAALWRRDQSTSLKTIFHINGLAFHFDATAGQKTGAFLDQRLNYAAAARAAALLEAPPRRALDVCTYQGGFALHLARTCARVTGVDASRAALEVADQNLELNRTEISSRVDWIEADAFELLRDFADRNERFDAIVLDPPAFAKSRRAAEGAMRGYKELNLQALKMLTPGGALVTCSCSHHVSLADFTDMLRSAAADTGRRVQLLEARGAAPDHPAILTLPETTYLKCLICRVAA